MGNIVANIGAALAGQLEAKSAFHSDAQKEMPKFAILRIAFGMLMVHRAVMLIIYALPGDLTSPVTAFFIVANFVAAIAVTAGLFSQFSLAFLVLAQWQLGDAILQTSTLGNDIGAILAVFLMVANAGAHLSVDGWIIRKQSRFGLFVGSFYYRDGLPPNEVLQLAKFFSLFSYWLVCMYSLSMHLNEPAWQSGTAGPLLLSNNFMSRFHELFEFMFSQWPLTVHLARSSLWVMMFWYAFIFPFVLLGGWLRQIVIVWGFLFFCLSAFELQLGWLGAFEFLFWAGLFWRHNFIDATGHLAVAYDDRCNLCDRTVNFLLRADVFQQLQFKPLTKNAAFLAEHGIETKLALTDLYGVDLGRSNSKFSGYSLYLELTKRVLLLTPAFPILLLGQWIGVGPVIYAWVAARRTRLFGVCELPTPKPNRPNSKWSDPSTRVLNGRDPALAIFSHIAVAGIAYMLLIPAPSLNWNGVPLPGRISTIVNDLAGQAHIFGITPINVFNAADLKMAENWFTLAAIDKEGSELLIPIFNDRGERQEWHVSDRIYFGRTVPWRRSFSEGPKCVQEQSADMLREFTNLYEIKTGTIPESYVYRQYYQPLANSNDILAGKFSMTRPKVYCTAVLNKPGTDMAVSLPD